MLNPKYFTLFHIKMDLLTFLSYFYSGICSRSKSECSYKKHQIETFTTPKPLFSKNDFNINGPIFLQTIPIPVQAQKS